MKGLPKGIINHPAVEECEYGPDIGFEEYKYSVFLREGWVFANGRTAGVRSGNFNTVRDFNFAKPIRKY